MTKPISKRVVPKHIVWLQILLLVLLLVLLCQQLKNIASQAKNLTDSAFIGSGDYIAYWSAYKIAHDGGDPYDTDKLLAVQQAIGSPNALPQQFWNPPWTLTLLSPVLQLPFSLSVTIWFLFNLSLVFLISVFSWKLSTTAPLKPGPCFLSGTLFVPVWFCLQGGQLSLLIAIGVIGAIFALSKKQDFLAGILLVLSAQKPHFVYLVLLALVWWILQHKRWKVVFSFTLSFILLLILGYIDTPSAYTFWRPGEVSPVHWQSATLVTFVRLFFAQITGVVPTWPMYAMPMLGAVILVYFLLQQNLDWNRLLAPLLCFSLLTAPYAWLFDQAVLSYVQVNLIAKSFNPQTSLRIRRRIILLLFLLQLSILLLMWLVEGQQYFVWIPLVMYFIWLQADPHETERP